MKPVIGLFFTFFILACFSCSAQSVQEDLALLIQHNTSLTAKDNNYRVSDQVNDKDAIKFKHRSFIARYNPLGITAVTAMYFYQQLVSPQMYRNCLYHRSCSNYGKAAIKEFGLIKGVFMSADRLLRCNMDAINDIPPGDFDKEGLAIDEPEKYHTCK